MSTTSDFYLERAEACAREAAATNLVNVRERLLRAEAAWRNMADRLLYTESLRRSPRADPINSVADGQ